MQLSLRSSFLLAALALTSFPALAQQHRTCGTARVEALYQANPALKANRDAARAASAHATNINQYAKGTAIVTIPVVFHIVLTQGQLSAIGDAAGVAARCASQIAALNADYAAKNADSTSIPSVFKPLFGATNIRYGLAHTDPTGHGTPGYDITIVTQNGFDENTSSFGGEVKHTTSGGKDGWDVTKYLNVWVENFLDGTTASATLGLTISPYTTAQYPFQFSANEAGVQLSFGAFGVRSGAISVTNYYTNLGAGHYTDLGRTLTHEFGHFFELAHIWGDDNGACPGQSGYSDDGISDTPIQGDQNFGCPTFPHISCTVSSPNGDMFMNYMDYVDDYCMHMFTKGQAAVMNGYVLSGAESYTLTQHPALLNYPVGVKEVAANTPELTLSPNPTNGMLYIGFSTEPKGLQAIDILNTLGQRVSSIIPGTQSAYRADLSGLAKGLYYVQCRFDGGLVTKKLILQ